MQICSEEPKELDLSGVHYERNKTILKFSEKQYYRYPVEYKDDYLLEVAEKGNFVSVLKMGFIPEVHSAIFENETLIQEILTKLNMDDFVYNHFTKLFVYQMFWWIASIRGLPLLKVDQHTLSTFQDKHILVKYSAIQQYFILHTGYEPPSYKHFDKNNKYTTGQYVCSTVEEYLCGSKENFWIYDSSLPSPGPQMGVLSSLLSSLPPPGPRMGPSSLTLSSSSSSSLAPSSSLL